ncbi:unnamed protein product [Prorocentrum cordatum]|uniref:Terminase small subunit n=1 Tax=Prorocentrum cordatum TaxID=2364126 RepID=A0ABN9PC61_9DINO|nr:unnamed protein product [Polarella glacialis]
MATATEEQLVKLVAAMDRGETNELARYFHIKKAYSQDKQKAGEAKLHLMLNPTSISPFMRSQLVHDKKGDQATDFAKVTIAELRLAIIKGLVATGGAVKIGSPPPGALERAVQASFLEHSV